MKIASLITLVSIGLFSAANAFIITVESGFDKVVTTNSLLPIGDGTGFVATGFFSTLGDDSLALSTPADLNAAFRQFGNSGTFGFGGFPGVYQVEAAPGRLAPGSQFVNQAIYTILGNNGSIENSSQFVIFKHDGKFLADNEDPNDKTFEATLGGPGAYIMGGATTEIINVGGFDFPVVTMAPAVPEPSAALLGALGALGLLRRRRN